MMTDAMWIRDLAIFSIIQIAMVLLAFVEAYQEGGEGWKHNPLWFSIPMPDGTRAHAYHVFMFAGILPLFIFGIPLILVGWDAHLMLVLLFSFIFGLTLEDFMWFVVNPQFNLKKWHPKHVTWYPWFRFSKKFALPQRYVFSAILCLILLPLIVAK